MRSLFRSFDRSGLEYLLISGQASVLYGASTFSEDVDVWVRPTPANLRRLLRALAACRARVHKLTPPVTLPFVRAGHGFHFVAPSRPLPVYLDVMGRPPRVGPFAKARRRARMLRTSWGLLPTVSIEDLVALKRTRRLSDYEVISNLARIRISEERKPTRSLLRWAARNTFRAEERRALLRRLGEPPSLEVCRREIAREVAAHQRRDAAYWRPRIHGLRRLRRQGRLLPEGLRVARLRRGFGPSA